MVMVDLQMLSGLEVDPARRVLTHLLGHMAIEAELGISNLRIL